MLHCMVLLYPCDPLPPQPLQGPFDLAGINKHCQAAWGVEPRVHHSFVQYGGVEVRGPLEHPRVFCIVRQCRIPLPTYLLSSSLSPPPHRRPPPLPPF